MTTWIDVLAFAHELRDRRDGGQALDGGDADRLLTVLLAFHERAVASTPPPDPERREPSAS
jgi:hypothetical protein